jgi:hypothetical protein
MKLSDITTKLRALATEIEAQEANITQIAIDDAMAIMKVGWTLGQAYTKVQDQEVEVTVSIDEEVGSSWRGLGVHIEGEIETTAEIAGSDIEIRKSEWSDQAEDDCMALLRDWAAKNFVDLMLPPATATVEETESTEVAPENDAQ